eukprot:319458-Prorocentrum_minimum.AAC.1
MKRRYILTTDQSDARSAGIFSRRTHQTQEAQVYSHDGPIRRKKHRYILTTDQSEQEAQVYSHDGPIRRRKR